MTDRSNEATDEFFSPADRLDAEQPKSPIAASRSASLAATLTAGLEAIKRRDYTAAIPLLETVAQTNSEDGMRLKAQAGLVKAYAAQGNLTWAIALCQSLLDHDAPDVRQWADNTLVQLNQRLTPDSTQSQTISQPPTPSPPDTTSDATGFVPLSKDGTGFVPLDKPSAPERRQRVVLGKDSVAPPAQTNPDSATSDTPSPPDVPSENPFALAPDAIIVEADWPASPSRDPSPDAPGSGVAIATSAPTEDGATQTISSPEAAPTTPPIPETQEPQGLQWREAGRAQKWNALGRLDLSKFRVAQVVTAIAPFALLWAGQTLLFAILFYICHHITWPFYLRGSFSDAPPLWPGAILLVALYALSPWVLLQILQRFYGARPLPPDLLARYSPEATRSLKRFCNQQRCPVPQLQIIYTPAPFVLTYGNLRRNLHITITQGVLDQLKDDEIATLMLASASHVLRWDFPLLSWIALTAQFPYLIYRQSAAWADRQSNAALHSLGILVLGISYGLYRVLQWPGLWLSRFRSYYGDRTASEVTGNPNGLTRALLKLNMGITQDIRRQGQVHPLVESFSLLAPVDYRTAITLGSACLAQPVEPLLAWDQQNPHRRWLVLNHSHPPLGDRLYLLQRYAHHWRLASELEFPKLPQSSRDSGLSRDFLLQIIPFAGMPLGIAAGFFLWLVGAIAGQFQVLSLSWMWGDWSLVWGCLWMGCSMGIFLRINTFYPDIPRLSSQDHLPQNWLTNPTLLPVNGEPVRLQGRLLGITDTAGVANQDLTLQVQQTLVKLHFTSAGGPLGNLFAGRYSPRHLVKRPVIVTGWLRRGGTPWIDVETIHLTAQEFLHGRAPIWDTLLACVAAFLGIYIILGGNAW
jgi:Zn-dependent protease with chaperone function